MKNVLMIIVLLCSCAISAQPGDREPREHRKERLENSKDWTPEQRADIKSKKIALHLDLSAEQQQKAYAIELQIATKRQEMRAAKENKAERTATQQYELKKRMLEEKLSIKQQYKAILSPEQYEKWEKTIKRKNGKGVRKGKHHRQ